MSKKHIMYILTKIDPERVCIYFAAYTVKAYDIY